jgi:hypothetical protein
MRLDLLVQFNPSFLAHTDMLHIANLDEQVFFGHDAIVAAIIGLTHYRFLAIAAVIRARVEVGLCSKTFWVAGSELSIYSAVPPGRRGQSLVMTQITPTYARWLRGD